MSFCAVAEERPDVERVSVGFPKCFSASLLLKILSVQALTRLTPREAYDRAFRFKRASQASVQHKDLPKSEWIKPEEVSLSRHSCIIIDLLS